MRGASYRAVPGLSNEVSGDLTLIFLFRVDGLYVFVDYRCPAKTAFIYSLVWLTFYASLRGSVSKQRLFLDLDFQVLYYVTLFSPIS